MLPSCKLPALLAAGETDFVLARILPEFDSRNFNILPLRDEKVALMVRAGHPLARAPVVTPAESQGHEWIMQRCDAPIRPPARVGFVALPVANDIRVALYYLLDLLRRPLSPLALRLRERLLAPGLRHPRRLTRPPRPGERASRGKARMTRQRATRPVDWVFIQQRNRMLRPHITGRPARSPLPRYPNRLTRAR